MGNLQLAQNASSSLGVKLPRNSSTSRPTTSAPERRACTELALLLSVTRGRSIARKSSIFAVMKASCRLPLPSRGDREELACWWGEFLGDDTVGSLIRPGGSDCCHSVRRMRRGFATSIVASRSACRTRVARSEKRPESMSLAISVREQSDMKWAQPGWSISSKSMTCKGETDMTSKVMS